jgi:6-phosphogluconate dehydrogenase (decarboxylating)
MRPAGSVGSTSLASRSDRIADETLSAMRKGFGRHQEAKKT